MQTLDKVSVNFLKDFIYSFLERGGGRKKEGEKHWQGIGRNPGMCPDWELNWQPFVLGQEDVHPTEPQRSGQYLLFFKKRKT